MDNLNEKESLDSQVVEGCNWEPEYGGWMVEATLDHPYTGFAKDLLRVELNMRLRCRRLVTNETAPTNIRSFHAGHAGRGRYRPTHECERADN